MQTKTRSLSTLAAVLLLAGGCTTAPLDHSSPIASRARIGRLKEGNDEMVQILQARESTAKSLRESTEQLERLNWIRRDWREEVLRARERAYPPKREEQDLLRRQESLRREIQALSAEIESYQALVR
jgi:chromosome segregation ATPase